MSKDENSERSPLYYVALSALLTLLAVAALSQGQTDVESATAGDTQPLANRDVDAEPAFLRPAHS